ncbi:hypothetical protein TanjilG_18869 [Lupinus angustifolius]|uniref:Dirigent protein n=1 Tax=Lupinus angustifolius TaxID=3871 RepID=A0A4P1RQG2_LUPAN|nr:PREDICTED: dirigent protein 15-like [Lupinus angustifolius]OIW16154.1 hypothetical protein TanjilG_18869 [Lupinus angustifolius]
MKNISIFMFLSLLFTSIPIPVHSKYYTETSHGFHLQEKVTYLHFYFFDILSGKNPTAVEIAHPNTTFGANSTTQFGKLYAIHDYLREGPNKNSKVIGNAQGLYLSSSLDDSVTLLVVYIDIGFTTGKFSGSSISVFSRNPITEANRELAVVGGRGKFKMARGFAETKTQYLNITNGDAIVEYKVTVVHY